MNRFEALRPSVAAAVLVSASILAAAAAAADKPADARGTKTAVVETAQPAMPALIRKPVNPVLGINVKAGGTLNPPPLAAITVTLDGTTRPQDVRAVRLLGGGPAGPAGNKRFGEEAAPRGEMVFRGEWPLQPGDNWFWVCVDLLAEADIDGRIDAAVRSVKLDDGSELPVVQGSGAGSLRIGVAVRRRGDDGVGDYRIPGLATTTMGTLIGVYDIRRRGAGDLPNNIDVGMSRSADGGRTWEPMRVILDMGSDPRWSYDGAGDPAVLVDESNNHIWVAGLWSHGRRAWHGSGKGMTPDETGQLVMVHSDDDGRTWSKPINVTGQVKDPNWHLLLQGPGRGICLKDGTLVFAAQFQAGKDRRPYSTLISSRDHGKTWSIGVGVAGGTTEAQLVELGDGSIMINCRGKLGARTVATTRDLGRTWTPHPTDGKALNDPVCMGSLLRIEHARFGPLLLFSNPNTPLPGVPRGRYNMTLKVSTDEGMTWPVRRHTLYDVRPCSGYSCLSPVGKDRVGVLYEGPNEIYFLRFPIAELMADEQAAGDR